MRKLIYILVAWIGLSACEEETFYPLGLYDYQVERLLTGGNEQGTWLINSITKDGANQEILSCSDSVRWVFEQVTSDSISVYELTFDAQCLFYDTLIFGQLAASGSNLLFTDSLKFDAEGTVNDRFISVSEVTSKLLRVNYRLSGSDYIANLEQVPSLLLERQASGILTDGISGGSVATWRAVSEVVDGVSTTRLDTCTNARLLQFEREATGSILLTQFVGNTVNCQVNELPLGEVVVGAADGYFDDVISLSGNSPDQISFTSLSASSMSISYVIQDTILIRSVYLRE